MPTVLRVGPFRFLFYAGENCEAKFWLDLVLGERSGGFRRKEMNGVRELVEEDRERLRECWNEFFHS
jgi:Domain of unknown function (DUF4160)